MTDANMSYGVGLSVSAVAKRSKQLAAWETSETNRLPTYLLPRSSNKRRVKFSKEVMFLAAVASGDEDEVKRLLTDEGVNVNCRNSDGLTAVHQCCIDDDISMLKFIVKNGGDVNSIDNEGWTPLHAAASCNFIHIVKYLLENGAHPAIINNEGQTPLDLAEDYEDIIDILQAEMDRLGIDLEGIRSEEEMVMLEDANELRNNPNSKPLISSGGATPIHVAAAKNYTTVLNVLLSIPGLNINERDDDGWTPLHAAVHWDSIDAARLLILNGANMYAKTNAGEEVDDLIDPELEDELKELKALNSTINPEQDQLRIRKINRRINTSTTLNVITHPNNIDKFPSPKLTRRLSKEKINVPKMIDMKKEKKDLMESFEKLEEEVTNNNVVSVPNPSQALPVNSSPNDEAENIPSNRHPPPMVRTNSSGGSSPKNNRKKSELSQRMLDRLNMFEIGNGSNGPATPTSPSVSSSLQITRTSTPPDSSVNSNGNVSERKKVDSSDKKVDSSDKKVDNNVMRPRVSSMDPTSGVSSTSQKNRFSFQSKPVLGSSSSKSMSLDRGSELQYKEAIQKQSQASPSPSSSSSTTTTPRKTVESKKETTPSAATPTTSTPTSSQPLSSTPLSEASIGSTSTDSVKERSSSSISQPEAMRKSHSKRVRETRRSTQPVPTNLLEQISQHDKFEEQQLEGHVSPPTAASNDHKVESAQSKVEASSLTVAQSAYRPPERPTQKVPIPSIEPATPPPTDNGSATKSGSTGDDSSSNLSPQQIPRSKSSTRRKPKEKRRHTGIPTEVDEEGEIPDNLKGIISHSRSGSGDSSDGSVVTNSISDVQGIDEGSISSATIEYYQQEIDRLKKLLNEERKKSETAVAKYNETHAELEVKRKEISSLQQKFEITNRALEQESMEKEQKEKRIMQLEKSHKGIPELKAEIQRLKDENGALIRVVGKLSRAPFTS